MPAQKGKDLLVKVDATGSGVYETVAGLRATRISLNAETVDVTNANSAGQWRELLTGAGARSASVSGSGVFRDSTSDALVQGAFFNAEKLDAELVVPDFGVMSGAFQVTSLEYAGDHDGEATFEISLASAGALSFTAL
ncbi:MAG: phage major tail protein, TP901-1 family [Pikeienuella sp.]